MRVLVVGGGGREHALLWKLRQSARVTALYCAPGNAGTAALAENVAIAADDVAALRDFARRERIDATVVGPELPLVLGIADDFTAAGLRCFGPCRAAAALEGSKAFAKDVMARAGVPTARHAVFDDAAAASRYVDEVGAPVVVKADGLAAGKGVAVCATRADAQAAIDTSMRRGAFGDAGRRVVIEEFLAGEEVSFMAVTDGDTVVPLASSQDHKRLGDGDTGPNTGGMGAYSPSPLVTPALERAVMEEIVRPVIATLAASGIRYRGVLYAGLMVDAGRAKVLEFNVRFGDPECQVLMLRLRSDLLDLVLAVTDGTLVRHVPQWETRASAGVVLAANGYPNEPVKGDPIAGLDGWQGGVVFHSGTARRGGAVVTNGGRVLTLAALGRDVAAAVANAYTGVERIRFAGMRYRRDIGRRGGAPPR
ncbi:MAG: phosphoribosylamine--glycine ligase [Deltaproteobacteria bacterium]|nr:MAG: phosphoribosylamine--glycine ligase [Deltaproteobacteria bacterium]